MTLILLAALALAVVRSAFALSSLWRSVPRRNADFGLV